MFRVFGNEKSLAPVKMSATIAFHRHAAQRVHVHNIYILVARLLAQRSCPRYRVAVQERLAWRCKRHNSIKRHVNYGNARDWCGVAVRSNPGGA